MSSSFLTPLPQPDQGTNMRQSWYEMRALSSIRITHVVRLVRNACRYSSAAAFFFLFFLEDALLPPPGVPPDTFAASRFACFFLAEPEMSTESQGLG